MRSLLALVVWLVPVAAAFAEDFDAALPRMVYGGSGGPRDAIAWGRLTREDFQGEQPPPHLASHAAEIGAVSCVSLGLQDDTRPRLSLEILATGERRYTAQVEALRYTAFFDRLCSWWNPGSDAPAYQLEHEQIHFDLTELAARELGRELRTGGTPLRTRAATEAEALAKLEARLAILVRQALRRTLERQARFDRETSAQKDAARQAQWAREVASELAGSDPSPR